MRVRAFRMLWLLGLLAATIPALAQFGHPLKGTWSGEWGPNATNRNHVLLELHWDGRAVTGTLNPGPDAVPLKKATLDPATWAVHFEADEKDARGSVTTHIIDGKLENIGAYRRRLSGTWSNGAVKGTFLLIRN